MRVELRDHDGLVGEVRLSGGHAVPSNDAARRTMEETAVVLPGRGGVTPQDGEDYLRGLAISLRGSYFWAVLIKDDA